MHTYFEFRQNIGGVAFNYCVVFRQAMLGDEGADYWKDALVADCKTEDEARMLVNYLNGGTGNPFMTQGVLKTLEDRIKYLETIR